MLPGVLRLTNDIFLNQYRDKIFALHKRNVQISVIGAANDIGSNVAILLKQNSKVSQLLLYDDDDRVKGIGMELAYIPGGPIVSAYTGETSIGDAIHGSHIILMSNKISLKRLSTRQEMLAANGPIVLNLCKAILDYNPNAFLAISTDPLNSIVPFASALLSRFGIYNPYKILGITHINTVRCQAWIGNVLQVNPTHLEVPVIGGHSDETIVPLFSNISPSCFKLDTCQADVLTRLIRKAETKTYLQKHVTNSSVLATAWSIHKFIDGLIDAVCGKEVVLNCLTANSNYGTRYFSGPTCLGYKGIIRVCSNLPLNEKETNLLNAAIPIITRDVKSGEQYERYFGGLHKF